MTQFISGTTSVTMIAEADVGLACTKYSLSWLSFNVYTLKSFKTFKCSSIGRQKDLAQMLRGIHFICRPACEAGFNPRDIAVQTCFQGRFHGAQTGSDAFGAHIMMSGAGLDAWICSNVKSYHVLGDNRVIFI